MSRIFISNIPEKFQSNDLSLLLQQINIPCTNPLPLKIMKSKHYRPGQANTGRFIVLSFDTEALANSAMEAINQMVLTVDQQETSIKATPFIPNFRQYQENKTESNIVIFNLPYELTQADLLDLFCEYGKILSASVISVPVFKINWWTMQCTKIAKTYRSSKIGQVLFETKDAAMQAIKQADGKFLSQNKLSIRLYESQDQRLGQNRSIVIRSLPDNIEESDILNLVKHAEKKDDVKVKNIQTLIDKSHFNMQNDDCLRDNGDGTWLLDKEELPISNARNRNLNSRTVLIQNLKPIGKLYANGRGGKLSATAQTLYDQIFQQFQKYGEIDKIKIGKGKIIDAISFIEYGNQYNFITALDDPQYKKYFEKMTQEEHANQFVACKLLYKTKEAAQKAVQEAENDEEKLESRLASEGCKLKVEVMRNQKSALIEFESQDAVKQFMTLANIENKDLSLRFKEVDQSDFGNLMQQLEQIEQSYVGGLCRYKVADMALSPECELYENHVVAKDATTVSTATTDDQSGASTQCAFKCFFIESLKANSEKKNIPVWIKKRMNLPKECLQQIEENTKLKQAPHQYQVNAEDLDSKVTIKSAVQEWKEIRGDSDAQVVVDLVQELKQKAEDKSNLKDIVAVLVEQNIINAQNINASDDSKLLKDVIQELVAIKSLDSQYTSLVTCNTQASKAKDPKFKFGTLPLWANFKYSGGMALRLYVQLQHCRQTLKKFNDANPGVSVSVYRLNAGATLPKVKEFFGKYGNIVNISELKMVDEFQKTVVQYDSAAGAEAALTKAVEDEAQLGIRLADGKIEVYKQQDSLERFAQTHNVVFVKKNVTDAQ